MLPARKHNIKQLYNKIKQEMNENRRGGVLLSKICPYSFAIKPALHCSVLEAKRDR